MLSLGKFTKISSKALLWLVPGVVFEMMVGKGQTPNRDIFRALFCDPGLAHETVGLSIDFKMTIDRNK